jgi:hypothetical protein
LGSSVVEQVCCSKHLGLIISTTGDNKASVQEACKKGKGSFMSLAGTGVRPNGLNPLTCSKLLKLVVYPKALFGCELWNQLSPACVEQLERMQRFCLKIAQTFTKRTRSDKVLCMLGMPRIQANIMKLKLSFFRRLCLLPDSIVAKQVFVIRFAQHVFNPISSRKGFMADIMAIRQELNLGEIICSSILEGIITDKCMWEETILNNIVALEHQRYMERTCNDLDFVCFNKVQDHCFSHSLLWDAAYQIPSSLPKFSKVARLAVWLDSVQSNRQEVCMFCQKTFYNPIIHALISCDTTSVARNRLMDFISNYCSVYLEAYIISLSDCDFVCTMFGSPIPDDVIHSIDIHHVLLYRFALYIDSVSSTIYELLA